MTRMRDEGNAGRRCTVASMEATPDHRLRAELKLAARSYEKALAKHAAQPSEKRALRLAARRAELTALLERLQTGMPRAA